MFVMRVASSQEFDHTLVTTDPAEPSPTFGTYFELLGLVLPYGQVYTFRISLWRSSESIQ